MNKAELIAVVATKIGIQVVRSKDLVNAVLASMTAALAGGEDIEIRGFGSFTIRQHAPREWRNPKTGAVVKVKRIRAPLFRVGKALRERVSASGAPPGRLPVRRAGSSSF